MGGVYSVHLTRSLPRSEETSLETDGGKSGDDVTTRSMLMAIILRNAAATVEENITMQTAASTCHTDAQCELF